jgi:hypothetical protein
MQNARTYMRKEEKKVIINKEDVKIRIEDNMALSPPRLPHCSTFQEMFHLPRELTASSS